MGNPSGNHGTEGQPKTCENNQRATLYYFAFGKNKNLCYFFMCAHVRASVALASLIFARYVRACAPWVCTMCAGALPEPGEHIYFRMCVYVHDACAWLW